MSLNQITDIIPEMDSAETGQNSEPSLAVNPANPDQIIAGAFTNGTPDTPYFVSGDGGLTWANYANLITVDKSIAWEADGTAVLTATLLKNTISTFSGSGKVGDNFGLPINSFSSGLDQPWIRTGPLDHVYLAYNNLSQHFGTASVALSTTGGASYSQVLLDRIGLHIVQDAPSVRLAVSGNTVYAAFTRWNTSIDHPGPGETRYGAQVIVERSDDGGKDRFKALGLGGNGVEVAAPTSVFANKENGNLTLGQERTGGDLAIAVDPNNPQHVVLAYGDSSGPRTDPLLQTVVTESLDGGVTWKPIFTTDKEFRTAQPAIDIADNGTIGFLYDQYDPATNSLSQHFVTTTDHFATLSADILLATETNTTPKATFQPYLGDFFDLTHVGNDFMGVFSASNADNGTLVQFPNGVSFLRDFTGTPGKASFQLTDANKNPVASSIDPFFFDFYAGGNDLLFNPPSLNLPAFGTDPGAGGEKPMSIPTSTSNINWAVTVRFDPNDLQASASGDAQHGIKIPSYGNYGGPNYSAGVENGTTPEQGSPEYKAHRPVDALDYLFYEHDLVYQHFPYDTAQQFQADVTLLVGIDQLLPTLSKPEARLYAGLAELTFASKIGLTPSPEAIQNFESALAATPGADARSLNGAFHVFEAHTAQQLVHAIASFGSPSASESSNIPSPHVSETSHQPLLTTPQHGLSLSQT